MVQGPSVRYGGATRPTRTGCMTRQCHMAAEISGVRYGGAIGTHTVQIELGQFSLDAHIPGVRLDCTGW